MAGPWDDYQPEAASAGPWNDYAPVEKSTLESIKQGAGNLLAGAVRGAGSIGATVLAPYDMAKDALAGKGFSLESNRQRRADMDGGLKELGAEPDSWMYKGGKLGTEIAGTLGVGGGIANVAARVPGVAGATPNLLNAIRTSGMTAGATPGAANMATRIGGGAITGGVSAGMVNPEDTGIGALAGGAFPVATKLAGEAGGAIGRAFGPAPINPVKLQTARDAMNAGYVIPPSMVQPSFGNRMMETLSGKHETAQLAATKNQGVTEGLVRKGLGLPGDAPLTFDSMRAYRGAQHAAGYEPLRNVGSIPAGQPFNDALDAITKQYTGKGTIPAIEKIDISKLVNAHRSNGFDSGDAVDAIRILRENASEAFTKGDNAMGKASKAIANAYEGAIDDALKSSGQTDLLAAYREARQNIAKSATVEKAIREGSGTLDARILGRELQKGRPLSGDIKMAAQFGNVFDKAAQPPHLIGSPGVNNLKAGLAALTSGIGGAAMGPAGLALGATNYLIPPMARARMFSEGAQRGLLSQPGQGGLLGGAIDKSLPSMYRINGLLASELSGP